jgi:antitoxin VapB
MSKEKTETGEVRAKLFRNGRSQAVRLPKEFRFEGSEVRIRHAMGGVLLEPVKQENRKLDIRKWFAEMDVTRNGSRFPDREEQPSAEERDPIQ